MLVMSALCDRQQIGIRRSGRFVLRRVMGRGALCIDSWSQLKRYFTLILHEKIMVLSQK